MQEIVLGGGCFWCVEAVFHLFEGIEEIEPGYAGGKTPNPSYREVCSGSTGHAEVVRLKYDENNISLESILEIFFHAHDPTTLNRQGNDVGSQYRSIVFYSNEDQRETIDRVIHKIEQDRVWDRPIVTQVEPFTAFYAAEDYHKNYYDENSSQPYCNIVIGPKVKKLRNTFSEIVKS
jgi:peptide-methionine (S)-S-oxide reductase